MKKSASTGWSWPLFFLVSAGIAVSGFVFVFVADAEKTRARTLFHEIAERQINAVEIAVIEAGDMVAMLGSYLGVAHPVSRADFAAFLRPIIAGHSSIQALEWIPEVPDAERQAFEGEAAQEGVARHRITERAADGNLIPAARRDRYFPVAYVEPLEGNEPALGFDLASNSIRREALEHARATGRPAATARVTLVQERRDQYGFLIFAPVHRGGAPSADKSANDRFLGFALGVFRFGDIVTHGRSSDGSVSPVEVHLFDLSAADGEQRLYPKMDAPENRLSLLNGPSVTRTIAVGGREWQIIVTPGAAMAAERLPVLAIMLLAAGLGFTALAVLLIKSNLNWTAEVARWARDSETDRRRLTEAQALARVFTLMYDAETGELSFDAGAAKLLELPQSGVHAADFLVHVPADERDGVSRALTEVTADDGLCELEFTFLTLDGRNLSLHILGRQTEGDDVIRLISVQDVTARRAVERERRQWLERVIEANKFESLGTLAGGIAHEINTPTQYVGDNLRFLQSSAETLLGLAEAARQVVPQDANGFVLAGKIEHADLSFLADELPQAIRQSIDGIEKIGQIVQAIKEFSYPSTKSPTPFDLNRAVRMAATVTRNQWKYVADLSLDLDESLSLITAIEGEINQVLLNLIVNAAQAVAEVKDNGMGRIVVSTRPRGGDIELKVRDTGPGIPRDRQRRIFDLFYTTKAPGQGTGQGLAIVLAVVRHHGGSIEVESEPGAGASFTVRLPRTPPAVAQAA